jgi:HEAT repeat protein
MNTRTCALLVIPALLSSASAHAQQGPVPPSALARPGTPDDMMLVTQGWLLLSQGSAIAAVARAREVLARSPSSPGAVALAVEAEIARGGSLAGLAEYERWLAARPHQEPLLLRRVSQAVLREAAAQTSDQSARLTALRALAADGDPAAVATLHESMAAGSLASAGALAESGNPDAVKYLVDAMTSRQIDAVRGLEALGKSHSPQAASAALSRLDDPRTEVRAAAIDALGALQAREAAPRLRLLLNDDRLYLRVRAAAALLAIGDEAGLPVIQGLAASESAQDRLVAVQAMGGKRDAAWLEIVRKLTTASEPEIRLGAAQLLAEQDPSLSASVFASLREDPNPAVRTLANDAALRTAVSDLSRLRALLHSPALDRRVGAAERVLLVTR